MSEHHEEFLDLCAAMALGVLDDVGRRRLEDHLAKGCATCEAALTDFSVAAVALASTAPAAKPSSGLRARVLSAARSEPRAAPSRRFSFVQVALVAASVALLATTVALWQRSQRLLAERDGARAQVDELARQLEGSKDFERFIVSPQTDCFDLASTGAVDTTLIARACFDRTSGRALVVFDRAAAPTGHDYELWVLRGDQPESLGLMRADASGRGLTQLDAIPNPDAITAFAVSLEPAGGSTGVGPTGPVIRVAALGS